MNKYLKSTIILSVLLGTAVVALISVAASAIQSAERANKWRYFIEKACEYSNSKLYGTTSCNAGIDAVEAMTREDIKEMYESMK